MARETNIPLFLWVAAAILVHLTGGGGAERVSEILHEREEIREFADAVRRHLRGKFTTEVALIGDTTPPPEQPPQPAEPAEPQPVPETKPPEATPDPLEDDKKAKEEPDPRSRVAKVTKPENVTKPKPKADAEVKPKPEAEKTAEKPPEPAQKMETPNRVAVQQHVKDKNQENDNAEFIAEEANRVDEQTQARITANDQNDEAPSPGAQHNGPTPDPGDSHETDIAQSEDVAGEASRAPTSSDKAQKAQASESVSQPKGVPEVAVQARPGPQQADPGQRAQSAQDQSRAQEAAPPTISAPGGAWSVDAERQARLEQAARAARRYRAATPSGSSSEALDLLGLGARGLTEGGLNLNLTPGTAFAAIGQDTLAREIRADGERRRSRHRGSWRAIGIERWRSAIENYVASVKLGNQTALNAARVPFAGYLSRIHGLLHPIFAGDYLGFLDGLPSSDPLNNQNLSTHIEIVLSQKDGSIVRMGVTRTSGVTAFDVGALESVQRASPFGSPPPIIVSPDGNVYLHWEFHRNPIPACSTFFARTYIIKAPQRTAPPAVPPSNPFTPEEEAPPAKQGTNEPPLEKPAALAARERRAQTERNSARAVQ
jgi:TonB-like protein